MCIASSSPTHVVKTVPPNMKLLRSLTEQTSRRERRGGWVRILAEAAAIAVGVFLSLWADQWREDRGRAAEGRESLSRIAADLAEDTVRMRLAAAQSRQGVVAIDSILNARPQAPSMGTQLQRWIPWVMQSDVFNPEGDEFEALRSSGRLGLISDSDLLTAVTSYYAELAYIAEMYRYDIDQSHAVAELMYPHIELPRSRYVMDSLPLFPVPEVAESAATLLSDPVFVNEMSYLGFLKELIAVRSQEASRSAARLLEVIEEELGS